MNTTTVIPIDKSLLEKLYAQLRELSKTVQSLRDQTAIPYVPLASKEERKEYVNDKKLQKEVLESRAERAKGGGIEVTEFFKQIEKRN